MLLVLRMLLIFSVVFYKAAMALFIRRLSHDSQRHTMVSLSRLPKAARRPDEQTKKAIRYLRPLRSARK